MISFRFQAAKNSSVLLRIIFGLKWRCLINFRTRCVCTVLLGPRWCFRVKISSARLRSQFELVSSNRGLITCRHAWIWKLCWQATKLFVVIRHAARFAEKETWQMKKLMDVLMYQSHRTACWVLPTLLVIESINPRNLFRDASASCDWNLLETPRIRNLSASVVILCSLVMQTNHDRLQQESPATWNERSMQKMKRN